MKTWGGNSDERLPKAETAASIVLKPETPRWVTLSTVVVVALGCNIILSVFVSQLTESLRSGESVWFQILFIAPFAILGFGMIGVVVYFFLGLFNPRPQLRVTPGTVRLGGPLRVDWEIAGRPERLQDLRIRLQGLEDVSYRRSTNACKDFSLFALVEIATVTAAPEIRSGSRTVMLPANLMHSFASDNNRIIWSIQVRGKTARRPNLKEFFPLTILPAEPTSPRSS